MRTRQEKNTQKADNNRIERTTRVLERLAKILGAKNDADLAIALHVPKTTLSSWKTRGSLPYAECERIAEEKGVSLDYLLGGKTVLEIHNEMRQQWPAAEEAGEYIGLPVYDVRAAAGGGAVVETEQLSDVLHFKQRWLETELRAKPGDLNLIYVDGDSMAPTLQPGDIILIDRRSAGSVRRDGIYVLRLDDALLVKRLQRLPTGEIRCASDNPAYESFVLRFEEQQNIAVIGRVVWAGRRM